MDDDDKHKLWEVFLWAICAVALVVVLSGCTPYIEYSHGSFVRDGIPWNDRKETQFDLCGLGLRGRHESGLYLDGQLAVPCLSSDELEGRPPVFVGRVGYEFK